MPAPRLPAPLVRRRRPSRIATAAATALLCTATTGDALAESGVTLLVPLAIDAMGATTFNEEGRAVGRSSFELRGSPAGEQTMRIDLQVEGGGSNYSEARLVPVESIAAGATGVTGVTGVTGATEDGTIAHRMVEERSQARSAEGHVFPLLVIDHARRRVSCYPDGQPESAGRHHEIPEEDRVVNVPMQLFFQPLVRGETETLRFQLATCKDGPVLYDMIAVRGDTIERNGRRIVEIEYGPDFGETVAWLASALLPSFSFWFDAEDASYLGHRMPLHRAGPEITLVRQGLTPAQIGAD